MYSVVLHTLEVGCMENYRMKYSFSQTGTLCFTIIITIILYNDIRILVSTLQVLMGRTNKEVNQSDNRTGRLTPKQTWQLLRRTKTWLNQEGEWES